MLNLFADTVLVSPNSTAVVVSPAYAVVSIALWLLQIVAWWKIFEKAGEKGWKSLIPIYNVCVLFKIAGREMWQVLLLLIPIVNIVIDFMVSIDVAHKFGKSTLFGVLSVFFGPICYAILGFGDAKYKK